MKKPSIVRFGNFRIEKKIYGAEVVYRLYRKHGTKIIGLVCHDDGTVCDLEVDKKYRRQGLARRLMGELIKDFGKDELSLMVDPEDGVTKNHLKTFYRSLGFKSADAPLSDYMFREPIDVL